MSTYYCFTCEKCKTVGGFFSRQSWGWGNCNIIENFAFWAKHITECGEEYIRIVSEHSFSYEKYKQQELKDLIDEEDGFASFPRSSDWALVSEIKRPKDILDEIIKKQGEK